MKSKRLGRGLGNLLNRTDPEAVPAERPPPRTAAAVPATPRVRVDLDVEVPGGTAGSSVGPATSEAGGDRIRQLPVARLRPNPFQPRTTFGADALEELVASIREHGMLQPIVVRTTGDGAHEIIAGERRLRAAQALGLATVPALVRSASDEEMQTLALVENLQREDLNAMEKARALKAMMRNFDLRQEDVASRVGKARTTIANILRLLDLPDAIQGLVEGGTLTGAHARALLQAQGTDRRLQLAKLAVERGWSVREVERRARSGPTLGKRRARPEDPYIRDLEQRLRQVLATEVRLQPRGKGGRIEVTYHDPDDLDRLLELLRA